MGMGGKGWERKGKRTCPDLSHLIVTKGVHLGMGREGNGSKYNNCSILMMKGKNFDEFGNEDMGQQILEVETVRRNTMQWLQEWKQR